MAIKIAFITSQVVQRPTSGGQIRLRQLQVVLSRIAEGNLVVWDVGHGVPADLVAPPSSFTVRDHKNEARQSPAQQGGGTIAAARAMAALPLFLWPSFNVRSPIATQLERVLAWVDAEQPSHAVVAHPVATELVPYLHARGIQTYVDCMNADADFVRQLITLSSGWRMKLTAIVRWLAIRRRERQNFPLADEVWVPSEIDVERARHISPGARIRAIPNAVDVRHYRPRTADAACSHDIVFVGDFTYAPNMAGARVTVDRVFPTVRETVPDARLVLCGRCAPEFAAAFRDVPGVVVTGFVDDVQPFVAAAGVMIVPLLHGGGTHYKLLEGLALGCPIVSTPLGCEGLDGVDGEHLLIRDIDKFPAAIISVLRDPVMGQRLGMAGRRLIESRYSWDNVERLLRESLLGAGGDHVGGFQPSVAQEGTSAW